MFAADAYQNTEVVDQKPYTSLPLALVIQPDPKLYELLADLSQDTSWGDRKMAAQKLGGMRAVEALPGLLEALPSDPFWMVRCAIIQALQQIGDPAAITTLRKVARFDAFQIVRSYAAKAVERLDQGG